MLELAKDPPCRCGCPGSPSPGTNCMLVCPVGIIDTISDPNSFQSPLVSALDKLEARLEICEFIDCVGHGFTRRFLNLWANRSIIGQSKSFARNI